MKEAILKDVKVMCITAESMDKIKDTFSKLEASLPTIKGRKFYGTFHRGVYKACVAFQDGDNPAALGLESEIIPGGKFVSGKLDNWAEHIDEIGNWFMTMTKEVNWDESRPSIEYYRSMTELIMYLPVK
jgi:hypothetical protein